MTTSPALQQLRERLGSERAGHPILLEELGDQLVIIVRTAPKDRLRLCEESSLSQDLERLGLSDEEKSGDAKLDERYVVRGNPALLTGPVKDALQKLEPFLEFEMTAREYRLLKELRPDDLTAVERVLDDLLAVVELTA